MSERSHGGPESPSNRENNSVREDPTVLSTSGGDSAGVSLVEDDEPVETRASDNISESEVLKLEYMDSGVGEGETQPSSSISRGKINDLTMTEVGNVRSEHEKVKTSVDYDTVLSEFDQFAAKGTGEAVGYGYEIGDMVWGKVKSHPWWPGHIYNEAFASPSVQRSKREGHVLVAFFGDSSYGWFDPAELVPFEENFVEKSRQTSLRSFTKASQEALDELSRRQSLGLACRCRNKFNFWPSPVKGYFVVDVGDLEPVVYSTSQINKARESFRPSEMLSFIQQLAVTPMTCQYWTLEFIKNKATGLACRKALFEEFDDTYAQAFGTAPVHPPKPTAPVAVDPLKAPLSGRLVFAEALGKQKLSVKPTKSKEQLEKDKYLFKRREDPIPKKTKKTGAAQFSDPLLVDGSMLSGTPLDSVVKGHMQLSSINQASVVNYIRPFEGSLKLVDVGTKKANLQKQRGGELSAENATTIVKKRKKEITMGDNVVLVQKVKKRKKEITGDNVFLVEKTKKREKEISEAGAGVMKLSLDSCNSEASVEKVSGVPLRDVPIVIANNEHGNPKNDDLVTSSSSEANQAVDSQGELPVLVKDLHALAIDPFHGRKATTRLVFLKFRSLVFQKSLVSLPQNEIETDEALHLPEKANKPTLKPLRALVRPDDPTKGGKKRGPSDRPEPVKKKKKLEDSDDIKKRVKLGNLEDVKKKKKIPDDSKPSSVEKKTPARSTESPSLRKVVTLESSKKTQLSRKSRNPTMLVMKFPPGASLPSGAHLRAKFARFGPLDHAATRVFWKTYTCRLVFLHKVDAEEALKFTRESGDLFGGTSVRSYIREVAPETAESEPIKIQREDTTAAGAPQSKDTPSKIAMPPHQQSAQAQAQAQAHAQAQAQAQLKSCLKKAPPGEEVGNGNNGRGTSRVKFILGGEESSKTEQLSSYPMDITSKNLPKFNPQSNVAPLPPHQMQKFPNNKPRPIQETPSVPENDISQQLLNLLSRCNDVVNNLSGVLGYVPYHTL